MRSLITAFRSERIAEFGVGKGANAKLFLSECPWIKQYIGIDVPPGTTPSLPYQRREVPQTAGVLVHDKRFKLIIRPRGTRDISAEELGPLDFVFIDGDHGLDAVKYDTALARKSLNRGVICWHDYGHKHPLGPSPLIDALNNAEGNHICHNWKYKPML